MTQEEMRLAFIDSTIRVISHDGLEKATTKLIAGGAHLNEGYLYRIFENKDELLTEVFSVLDSELVAAINKHIPIMFQRELEYRARCEILFTAVWRFLLSNRDKTVAFVRYYHSAYYSRYSAENHRRQYAPLLEVFRTAFRPEANVWMLMSHILNVILDFAVKVFDGELEDCEDSAEHVFRVIYHSVSPYFKSKEQVYEEGTADR